MSCGAPPGPDRVFPFYSFIWRRHESQTRSKHQFRNEIHNRGAVRKMTGFSKKYFCCQNSKYCLTELHSSFFFWVEVNLTFIIRVLLSAIKLKKLPEKITRPTAVFFVKLPGNKILIEMSSLLRQKKALVTKYRFI
jgi:hypothetical protein